MVSVDFLGAKLIILASPVAVVSETDDRRISDSKAKSIQGG